MNKLQYLLFVSGFIIVSGQSIVAAANTPDFIYLQSDSSFTKELRNDDLEELLKSAWELYRKMKYDEALANCVKASRLAPKDFRPHYFAGFIYMAQEKFKTASDEFAKAIALKPDEKIIYMYKADADKARGAIDEAIAACRKALEIDPSFAEAYLTLADILRGDEKRRAEADEAYRAAVKADPKVPSILENIGEKRLYVNKDKKAAEEMFRKAMELDPKRMAGRFLLGRMLVEQDRLKEAREIWEGRTTDVDNTFPNFITLLERAEKLKLAQAALAQKPNDPETLLQMGYAVMDGDSWVVDGRQEKAIVYFRKALEIKPDLAAAQFAIGKAFVQIADTFEAKRKQVDEELAKLRQMDPKLAKELEEYRKTYRGGLSVGPPPPSNR